MTEASVSLIDEPVEIAVVDYGMGNRRSVEKALEHVGARAIVSQRPRSSCAPRTGLVVPGVGAFPRAMERPARARARRAAARARRGGHAGARASAWACSSRSSAPSEHGGAERARASCPARCARSSAGELKLPHIGWNEVALRAARLAAASPTCRAAAPSTTCTRFAPVPARRAGRARRPPSTARRSSAPSQRGSLLRRAVSPREVLRRGPAPARQLRAHLHRRERARRPASRRQVRLYPAIDILGGNAVRLVQGRLRREEGLRRGPAVGRARAGCEAGAEYLHVVDLDGAKSGRAGQPRAAAARSPRERACRCSTAAGCARRRRSPRRSTRAPRA